MPQYTVVIKLLVLWRIRQAHLPLPSLNVAHKLQRAAQVRAHRTIQHWTGEWRWVYQRLLTKIVDRAVRKILEHIENDSAIFESTDRGHNYETPANFPGHKYQTSDA